MNAALLNSARTLNAGPEIPRDPAFDTTWQPVAGGVVVTQPPVASPGLDLEKLKGWAESGQKLLDAGQNPGMSVNPTALLSAITSGAVAGTAIPGIGTVAGAIIAGVVYVATALIGGAFGPGPSVYDNAGPNVHWWFTTYAPQAYLDWVVASNRNSLFASTAAAAQGYLVWMLEQYNWVAMPPPWSWWKAHTTWYDRIDADYVWDAMGRPSSNTEEGRTAWLQDFYANFGIDYIATKQRWLLNPLNHAGPLMLKNRSFLSDEELESGSDEELESGNGSETSPGTKAALGVGIAIAALAAINKSN